MSARKILERILGDVESDEPKKERVSVIRINEGDLEFPRDGEMVLEDGTRIGTLHTTLDHMTFSPKIRLCIPADQFKHLEVVCDGDALEITAEPMGDDRYRVKRKLRGFTPAVMDDESTIELPKFDTTKQFMEWIEKLPKDLVEAYRQIYYDRWNFDSGSQRDRIFYELLDEEYQGRE